MSGTIENRSTANTDYRPSVINGYELINTIENQGNQSVVYSAQKSGKEYAVKIYNSPLNDEMIDILDSVKSLNQNAIAEIIEFGESENHAYEIQQFYDPQSRSIDPKYFVSHILRSLNHALSELHLINIAHLDIKPENLYINKNTIKLLDFGVSARNDKLSKGYSFDYAAPELIEDKTVHIESDYYSLGITIFELIMGYNPFADVEESYKQQLKMNPLKWLPYNYMDPDLYELIFHLVIPNYKDRWGFSEVNHWVDNHDNAAYAVLLANMMNDVSQIVTQRSNRDQMIELIKEAVLNGNERIDDLFSEKEYDTIKIRDTKLAFLIGKYKKLYNKDKIRAAIKVKTEYSTDSDIIVPRKEWINIKEVGIDLLNYVTAIYDKIVKSDIERFEKEIPPISFYEVNPTMWFVIENNYIMEYVSGEKRELLSVINDDLLYNIKSAAHNDHKDVIIDLKKIQDIRYELVLKKECYEILYLISVMGYMLSEIKSFIFNNKEYNSLNELYDHLVYALNGNEEQITLYSKYMVNYIDQEPNATLNPILCALSDVINSRLTAKLSELSNDIKNSEE